LLAIAMIGIVAFIAAVCARDIANLDFRHDSVLDCEAMLFIVVLVGFGYFLCYVYDTLWRYAHHLLKSAGNQVLEIKKLE
jgi:hypothetical protein